MNYEDQNEGNAQAKPLQLTPILYATLKSLGTIKQNFNKTSKPSWRSNEFRCIVVVARIMDINPPTLLFADDTEVMPHDEKPNFFDDKDFVRSTYYHIVFHLTPFSPDYLIIQKIQPVHAQETLIHLNNLLSQELNNLTNEAMIEDEEDKESLAENSLAKNNFQTVLNLIRQLGRFTITDLAELKISDQTLNEIIYDMCEEGLIANLGDEYMVISSSEADKQSNEPKIAQEEEGSQ